MVEIVVLSIVGIGVLCALAIRFLSAPWFNASYEAKEYWLGTSERRNEAMILVLRFFLWFLFAIAVMAAWTTHSMFIATLHPQEGGSLSQDLPLILGWVLFVVVQVVLLMRAFSKPLRTHGK